MTRAIDEAASVDEILLIHDEARALRVAARVAGDREGMVKLAAIQSRALRRLGKGLADAKASGLFARGAAARKCSTAEHLAEGEAAEDESAPSARLTLADIGVDRKTSAEAQRLAALSDERLVGAPYLELFARKPWPGRTYRGDEVARAEFAARPARGEDERGEPDRAGPSGSRGAGADAVDRSAKWSPEIIARARARREGAHDEPADRDDVGYSARRRRRNMPSQPNKVKRRRSRGEERR